MDMSNSTYVLGIIVAIILASALVVFILWLLCPSNNCDTECDTTKQNCGWSGSNNACDTQCNTPKKNCGLSGSGTNGCDTTTTCKTKTCGGLSGSSQWSGGAWPGGLDLFSGRIGEKEVDC